jgi:hypothetical protein
MKITRRQLRKVIMEMPMGGYFGSMPGGTGEDFISAVEMESMKYPDHSIYIDDASNNPNEFVISSSRKDDAMGPHSHYLTSIHVEVKERDGLIYVDGMSFANYEQAAAYVLTNLEDERSYTMSENMKITKNKIRSLIRESIRKFRDPTDDPRFSDPSYSGRPGSYTLTRGDADEGHIGIRVMIKPINTVLEFEDHSDDDISEMCMAIIEEYLPEEFHDDAEQNLINALRGDVSPDDYFEPVFEEDDDDYDDDDYDDDPYAYAGNYGPDMFSR